MMERFKLMALLTTVILLMLDWTGPLGAQHNGRRPNLQIICV